MSSPLDGQGPPERSPEPLYHLVQYKMIEAFNGANEADKRKFKCWPVFSRGEDDRFCYWIMVVLTDAHEIHPDAKDCRLQIDGDEWWDATLIPNPSATIQVEGHERSRFSTYQVKVPRDGGSHKQPLFKPLEMVSNMNGGAPAPVFDETSSRCVRLHLSVQSTSQLNDLLKYKDVPDASWKFDDVEHYHDIQRWGTVEEFEFESKAIRDFNRQSVYKCWLILRHPSDDELQRRKSQNPRDMTRQQCIVVIASPDPHEAFPKVGDTCDLGFALKVPEFDHAIKRTVKDNHSLKREGLHYVKGVRLDNPHDQFSLNRWKWSDHATFKVWLSRKSARDFAKSPLATSESLLDPNALAADKPKPRITLDEGSSFQVHVWVDISDTTMSVELDALETAVGAPPESRIGEAFSFIRTFKNTGRNRNFNLLRAFPHMQNPDGPNSQLPENLKALIQGLDDDQRKAYNTILSDLPCRVGCIAGGPGGGKTELILTICALFLANHAPLGASFPAANGQTNLASGPILLILEANRPANVAATRVMQHFEKLSRSDLRVLRAWNCNYEGMWSTRKYLKVDVDDEESTEFKFDECFPTHRADHIPPRARRNDRSDCLAPTLREAAQQYLMEHPEDFLRLSTLVKSEIQNLDFDDGHENERQTEWDALFSAVLARTDFVITTPVGAAKLSEHFHPRLVIFDEAARARELSTLVAISKFPSAEAWLFTGAVEMTKPYVASHCNPNLWNPCAEQLRTSMMERCLNTLPDMHRLSLNHQAYGDLHTLSSDLFWGGQIESALPSSERFPASTLHLLEYFRNLASNPSLSVPRLLVHVKGPKPMDMNPKSKYNRNHMNWVVQRVIRDLVQDEHFRSIDNKEAGSIIVAAAYKAQFNNYRKEINALMRELDREHRLCGGHGERLHREVLVEARTADTVQGHSADVVIYDLVTKILTSHVADPNRMCVALTRAQQAEIIVMESSLLGLEGGSTDRRRLGSAGSCIDLLYEHCRSHGQVITVDMVEDGRVDNNYTWQRGGARPGNDLSEVPRQPPELPPSLDLPQDTAQVKPSPAVSHPGSKPPESTHDDDDEKMFESSETFSFEMVRKAMELGLNFSAVIPKGESP